MYSLQYRPQMEHFQNPKNGRRRPKATAPQFVCSCHGPSVACPVGRTCLMCSLCMAHLWPMHGLYTACILICMYRQYRYNAQYERGQKLCGILGTFVRCAHKCQTKIPTMVIKWEGYVGFWWDSVGIHLFRPWGIFWDGSRGCTRPK